jgi:hypothetical protein
MTAQVEGVTNPAPGRKVFEKVAPNPTPTAGTMYKKKRCGIFYLLGNEMFYRNSTNLKNFFTNLHGKILLSMGKFTDN